MQHVNSGDTSVLTRSASVGAGWPSSAGTALRHNSLQLPRASGVAARSRRHPWESCDLNGNHAGRNSVLQAARGAGATKLERRSDSVLDLSSFSRMGAPLPPLPRHDPRQYGRRRRSTSRAVSSPPQAPVQQVSTTQHAGDTVTSVAGLADSDCRDVLSQSAPAASLQGVAQSKQTAVVQRVPLSRCVTPENQIRPQRRLTKDGSAGRPAASASHSPVAEHNSGNDVMPLLTTAAERQSAAVRKMSFSNTWPLPNHLQRPATPLLESESGQVVAQPDSIDASALPSLVRQCSGRHLRLALLRPATPERSSKDSPSPSVGRRLSHLQVPEKAVDHTAHHSLAQGESPLTGVPRTLATSDAGQPSQPASPICSAEAPRSPEQDNMRAPVVAVWTVDTTEESEGTSAMRTPAARSRQASSPSEGSPKHGLRLALNGRRPSIHVCGADDLEVPAQRVAKHVHFDDGEEDDQVISAFTPYSRVYGQHPSWFDFDDGGNMVQPCSPNNEADFSNVDVGSKLQCISPCGVEYRTKPQLSARFELPSVLPFGEVICVEDRRGDWISDEKGWMPLVMSQTPMFEVVDKAAKKRGRKILGPARRGVMVLAST